MAKRSGLANAALYAYRLSELGLRSGGNGLVVDHTDGWAVNYPSTTDRAMDLCAVEFT